MGGAAVAGTVSTATMALLFGTAGAGLATYKVDRRTSGISEFVIEEYGGDEKVRFIVGDLNRNNSQIIEVQK